MRIACGCIMVRVLSKISHGSLFSFSFFLLPFDFFSSFLFLFLLSCIPEIQKPTSDQATTNLILSTSLLYISQDLKAEAEEV